jgi:Transmembrane amino acid transporter protein
MFVILLLGIIVAYVSAGSAFMGDTLFSMGKAIDAVFIGSVMAIVSQVPDMGYLSGASAMGLAVLLSAFLVIAGYGISETSSNSAKSSVNPQSIELWPSSLTGVSNCFGIVVFGFGVVPLTFNLQESMKEPKRMGKATTCALTAVAVFYIVIGVGLYALFPDLSSDVLHELPATGALPTLTRLAMTWTTVVTAPLLIVPCAELIEGKFDLGHTSIHRTGLRFIVAGFGVTGTVLLPGFVKVLSLVGAFCVALVSFCVPPLMHLRLFSMYDHKNESVVEMKWIRRRQVFIDGFLLMCGILATLVATIYTLRS